VHTGLKLLVKPASEDLSGGNETRKFLQKASGNLLRPLGSTKHINQEVNRTRENHPKKVAFVAEIAAKSSGLQINRPAFDGLLRPTIGYALSLSSRSGLFTSGASDRMSSNLAAMEIHTRAELPLQ
jgi:hypothetical protein